VGTLLLNGVELNTVPTIVTNKTTMKNIVLRYALEVGRIRRITQGKERISILEIYT